MQVADNSTAQALLNAALNALVDGIDVGSTNSYGQIVITDTLNGSGNDIVTIPFANPAYAAASYDTGNNWSEADLAGGSINADATASYTAAGFRIEDRNEVDLFLGSVGMSASDINLDNTNITSGQTVTLTSLEFRLPDGQ